MIAAFIAGEIWSDATAWRFWLGSKNRAIGAPATSVTVVVSGNGPSTTSVDTVVTVSPAALDTIPSPATAGNTIPAASTPATRHNPSNRATGRTSRRTTITTCLPALRELFGSDRRDIGDDHED